MSQLKAKQLKLAAEGDLLIGGAGGIGTVISATGKADQILRVVDGRPTWTINDNLKSENTFNTVKASDDTGVSIDVENATGDGAITLASFIAGSDSDEAFAFSSSEGSVTIASTGTADDVDIVIAPKGGGDVIIGNAGGGVIQADDGEDLALFGGDGVGNLFLNGGGTGKIYYASDANDPDREIATVGQVAAATAAATVTQTRSEFAGDEVFALNAKAVVSSIMVHINGLIIKENLQSYNSSTHVVTVNTAGLGYELDSVDQIVVTYEVTV